MIIETTELYILILVWMTLTFIQGHICFDVHFRANLGIYSDQIEHVAMTCWFVEDHARFTLHK